MVIMGIDGSTTSSGWAIIESDSCKRIDSGRIKPKGKEWRNRMFEECQIFYSIIKKYSPQKIYMEDVPMKDGKSTIMKLGAIQGMLISLAALFNIEIIFLLPSEWRSNLNLFDGTREGTHREVLKKKAVETANKIFELELQWVKEGSKLNEDDEAEALLVAYSQIQPRKFGKPRTL